jgi:hypothetical protein
MSWLLFARIVKKIFALAVFVWLIWTFHSEAAKKHRSRLGWVLLGMLGFYGAYFVAALGAMGIQLLINAATHGGFANIDKQAIPEMVAGAILYAIPVAFGVAFYVRRRLRGLPDLSADMRDDQRHVS